jgi:hypothetical protein
MIVIPYRRRALGRQIRGAIRADGRDKPQALLAHDPLHIIGQNAHHMISLDSVITERGFS